MKETRRSKFASRHDDTVTGAQPSSGLLLLLPFLSGSRFRTHLWTRLIPGMVLIVVALAQPVDALPDQELPEGGTEGSGAGPLVDVGIDVASADVSSVTETLDSVVENVGEKLTTFREAESALSTAETDLTAAREAVSATQARIDTLTAQSDDVVVRAFINPPAMTSVDVIRTSSVNDRAVKQTLLGMQASDDASVLEDLAAARSELEIQKEDKEDAESDAETARSEAEAELSDLQAAVGQHTQFIIDVESRLEHNSSEAQGLQDLDPALADELTADQDALAGELQALVDEVELQAALEAIAAAERRAEREAERRAREEAERQAEEAAAAAEAAEQEEQAPPELGAPSGSLGTANCPSGGSITVDSSLVENLSALLQAASADGVVLCGGGYRDPAEQVALREAHCGTSYYEVYEMPASQCSPPTARPGTSMHEQGLAIDFTCDGGGAIPSQSSSCFTWLDANAVSYGLYNLASEPWHWSTNGN